MKRDEPASPSVDLEAIQQRYDNCRELLYKIRFQDDISAEADMEWLLAEVDRLQAQVDAMDEVIDAAKAVTADVEDVYGLGVNYVVGKTAVDGLQSALARLDAVP